MKVPAGLAMNCEVFASIGTDPMDAGDRTLYCHHWLVVLNKSRGSAPALEREGGVTNMFVQGDRCGKSGESAAVRILTVNQEKSGHV